MKIGILVEGDYDYEPIKTILSRIIKSRSTQDGPYFDRILARGSIVPKIDDAFKLFFDDVIDPCDMAVFVNDMDKNPKRCTAIKRKVTDYMNNNPSRRIFVLCPDPCFEAWYFEEESALRKVLGLPMHHFIPYQSMHPKARLKKLIYEFNDDITRSVINIYNEIAENLNIQSLISRNAKFRSFYTDIL